MFYSFKFFLYSVYVLICSIIPVYTWNSVIDIFMCGNIEGRLLIMLIIQIVFGIITTIFGLSLLLHFLYCVTGSYITLYGKHKLFCDRLDEIENEASWFIGKDCYDVMGVLDKVRIQKRWLFLSKTLFEGYALENSDCFIRNNVNCYVDDCLKVGRKPVFVITLGRCYFLDELKEQPISNAVVPMYFVEYLLRCNLDKDGVITSVELSSMHGDSEKYASFELFNRAEAIRNSKSLNYRFNWFEKHIEENSFAAVFNSIFVFASMLLLVFK